MKLISCNRCGVVFDLDKVDFPASHNHDTGETTEHARWNGEDWVSSIPCPVCYDTMKGEILKS